MFVCLHSLPVLIQRAAWGHAILSVLIPELTSSVDKNSSFLVPIYIVWTCTLAFTLSREVISRAVHNRVNTDHNYSRLARSAYDCWQRAAFRLWLITGSLICLSNSFVLKKSANPLNSMTNSCRKSLSPKKKKKQRNRWSDCAHMRFEYVAVTFSAPPPYQGWCPKFNKAFD